MSLPQLWVFAGPNGAGKSTLARRYAAARIELVNPDDIAFKINPNHRGDPVIMLKAGREAIRQRNQLLQSGKHFGIETTLSGHSELAFMKEAREAGYKVNLVFVGISSVIQSERRVDERVRLGGHPVPETDLKRRFERSMGNLAEAMGIAHRTLVFDNSGKRRRFILGRENGRSKHISRKMPAWAKNAIPRDYRRHRSNDLGL